MEVGACRCHACAADERERPPRVIMQNVVVRQSPPRSGSRVSRASRTGVISGMTRGKIWDYVFAQRIRRERKEKSVIISSSSDDDDKDLSDGRTRTEGVGGIKVRIG